jgi:drug/metabolite transporter (DMT)-like permease
VLGHAGAVAFTSFHAAGNGADSVGHVFGYIALVTELLAYAAQMVLLPAVSKKYGAVTLTAMYYSVASLATAATLVWREHDDLSQVPALLFALSQEGCLL